MGDLTRPAGAAESVVRLWAKPIEPALERIAGTADKPLAEMTMPDLLSWLLVFGYALATGVLIGQLGGNLMLSALRGPVRLR